MTIPREKVEEILQAARIEEVVGDIREDGQLHLRRAASAILKHDLDDVVETLLDGNGVAADARAYLDRGQQHRRQKKDG